MELEVRYGVSVMTQCRDLLDTDWTTQPRCHYDRVEHGRGVGHGFGGRRGMRRRTERRTCCHRARSSICGITAAII